jgi:hypothetical protein
MKGQYLSPPVDDRLIWEVWLSSHNLPAMLAADQISLFDKLAEVRSRSRTRRRSAM